MEFKEDFCGWKGVSSCWPSFPVAELQISPMGWGSSVPDRQHFRKNSGLQQERGGCKEVVICGWRFFHLNKSFVGANTMYFFIVQRSDCKLGFIYMCISGFSEYDNDECWQWLKWNDCSSKFRLLSWPLAVSIDKD